jgi:hypothetical protein
MSCLSSSGLSRTKSHDPASGREWVVGGTGAPPKVIGDIQGSPLNQALDLTGVGMTAFRGGLADQPASYPRGARRPVHHSRAVLRGGEP